MILFYIVLIVYILAVNFYSFLYIFALHKAEKQAAAVSVPDSDQPQAQTQGEVAEDNAQESFEVGEKEEQLTVSDATSSKKTRKELAKPSKKREKSEKPSLTKIFAPTPVKGFDWKLLLCAALGGAITIYVCMFIFRYKLNNLLLMLLVPILAAVNGYFWFALLSSGFFIKA